MIEISPSIVETEVDTTFFREPSAIQTSLSLLKEFPNDQKAIACVGCSSGEEAYSLAAIAQEAGVGEVALDGYDREPRLIERATRGEYQTFDYKLDTPFQRDMLAKSMEVERPTPDRSDIVVRVPTLLKEATRFAVWDITQGALPKKYPVINCTNMLYYYAARGDHPSNLAHVLDNLADSLEAGGYLVCESRVGEDDSFYQTNTYLEELRSHPRFVEREDKVVPVTQQESKRLVTDRARVFQLRMPAAAAA